MTHTRDSIVSQLTSILVNELEITLPDGGVGAETQLFEGGLALDSFAVVDLISRIEERFTIQFADADFAPQHFAVGSLAALIELRLRAAGE